MQKVTFRLFEPQLNPRRTKYEIPGWMGEPEPRRDGSHEHAWHCVPFTEGAQYGIELFYPFGGELRVSRRDGALVFDGDLGHAPGSGAEGARFRSFGEDYYTYQILIDLKVGDDFAVLTQPHPRFYTDTKDETPIAVPALLRTSWWPMISFVVFKSPAEGRTHVFRPGEPFMQMLIVPAEPQFELVPMGEEEAAEREMRSRRIHASRDTLGKDTAWVSATETVFDGTYRHIHRAAKLKAENKS